MPVDTDPMTAQMFRIVQDEILQLRQQAGKVIEDKRQGVTLEVNYDNTRLFPSTGGTAQITVPTIIDMYAVTIWFPNGVAAGDSLAFTKDLLYVWPFTIPATVHFDRMTIDKTASTAAKHYQVGLYDSSKTLIIYGQFDGATTGLETITVTDTTLGYGTYWLGWTSDVTSPGLRAADSRFNSVVTAILNKTNVSAGTAGSTSGSSLPSTFTTITDVTKTPPACRFWLSTIGS